MDACCWALSPRSGYSIAGVDEIVTYAVSTFIAFLLHRVVRYRLSVVRANLKGAFPLLESRALSEMERGFYRNLADIVVEVFQARSLSPDEFRSRVTLNNVERVQEDLNAGHSVLILGAHQCNWEWMLLALSLNLGFPLDAAYKPLRSAQAERTMRAIRTRFGSRLVPAKELMTDLFEKRGEVRAIAMLADQEPVTSDYKWWTTFLGRQTAFYMGPEKIARATRFAVWCANMRRLDRGHYEMSFGRLAEARETFEPGVLTDRYARCIEAEIRANPADWMWSHRRWRLKRTDP